MDWTTGLTFDLNKRAKSIVCVCTCTSGRRRVRKTKNRVPGGVHMHT